MSEMVERVAKAQAGTRWESFDEEHKDAARQLARDAIMAMRDPTGPMLKAACASMSPGKRPTPDRVPVKEKHRIRYAAMIDEALK